MAGAVPAHAKKAIDSLWFAPFAYPALQLAIIGTVLGVVPMEAASSPALASLLLAPLMLLHVVIPVADMMLDALLFKQHTTDGGLSKHTTATTTAKTHAASTTTTTTSSSSSFMSRAAPSAYVVVNMAVCILGFSTAGAVAAAVGGTSEPLLPLAGTLLSTLGMQLPLALLGTMPLGVLMLLLAVSLGVCQTVGTVAAHELNHSRHPGHQALGHLHNAFNWLGAYARAHSQHHLTVGAYKDHSTARAGETVYAFAVRYLGGIWRISWELEAAELHKKGRHTWSMHNQVLQTLALQVVLSTLVYAVGGPVGLGVAMGAAVVNAVYFTAMDYLLHYGLVRKEGAPVSALHSWSSSYVLENAVFFKALLHSEHHVVTSHAYGDLGAWEPKFRAIGTSTKGGTAPSNHSSKHGDDVHAALPRMPPRLPMMSLSLLPFLPPVWERVVSPTVDSVRDFDSRTQAVK